MAASPVIRNSVAVGDPNAPANVIKPNANGSINTVAMALTANAVTDKSFTTDGADHVEISSNTLRTGWLIVVPSHGALNSGGDSAFVNYGAASTSSGDSFEVPAGTSFPPAGSVLFKGDIHVIGATGIKITAKEYT